MGGNHQGVQLLLVALYSQPNLHWLHWKTKYFRPSSPIRDSTTQLGKHYLSHVPSGGLLKDLMSGP